MSMPWWRILTRRKNLPSRTQPGGADGETRLGRVLNTFDLTALGVGATLGVGVYVLAGHVSRDQAGPAVILSFLIAAVASFLAGLCYAEFGARVPKAGSAYIYSYVCIGEFVAFITGWNLILQYIIGSASISRGLSLYLDTLIGDILKNTFRNIAPINASFLSPYFDFFAFALPILLAVALAFGLKKSAVMNNIFTLTNIAIVLFVTIAGAFKADIANWQVDPSTLNTTITEGLNIGEGGFFPFGIEGMLKGAATCFFGFVGFDCIATTGEEVKSPQRAIPRAILFSLIIIFLSYFGISTVLTLMWPYYLQDVNAPLPYAFEQIGWSAAKWIVAIGGIVGLITSLFGAMFPLPRIIYAMSQDGLVFRFLGQVHTHFKTPVVGTMCAGLLTGLVAASLDLKQLVSMLSIGTLLAYTVVAISITILRFTNREETYIEATESSSSIKMKKNSSFTATLLQIFNCRVLKHPTKLSSRIVGGMIFLYTIFSLVLCLLIVHSKKDLAGGEVWAIVVWSIICCAILITLISMAVQPRDASEAPFKVPLVPLLPGISIFINIYLMLMLDTYTWIFFSIWLVIGLAIYTASAYLYGQEEVDQESEKKEPHSTSVTASCSGSLGEPHKLENGHIGRMANEEMPDDYDRVAKVKLSEDLDQESDVDEAGSTSTMAKVEEKIQKTEGNAELDKRTSSLDEIHLVSELSDTHTEKKEPNGTSYFVEEARTPSPPQDREARVLAFLDGVIETEDTSPPADRKNSMDSVMDDEVIEKSTVAMIHCEDTLKEEDEECTDKVDDTPEATAIAEVEGSGGDVVTATVNTLPRKNHDETNRMKQSKSESDMRALLMRELQQRQPLKEPDIPPADYDPRDSVEKSPEAPKRASEDSAIPKPPIFDPILYNATTKRSPKLNIPRPKIISAPPMSPGKVTPRQRPSSEPPHAQNSPAEEESAEEADENNNGKKFARIKGKLEEILRRGPPLLFPRPRSKPPENVPQSPEAPATPTVDEEEPVLTPSIANPTKPFDTFHKQKILFNDVLKSIHPDTRPSVIRNESLNRRSATSDSPVVLDVPASLPEKDSLTH
ncbi:high affinity cationic amino acid transporter 1-like isoform X1 [Lutzomyia longipalpis]|uniref:Cationic amino acid transporter C-terminal domain-containing protein n=1 Tax=Lutzomyia longipalpis TaxID=7200 RepID=A0A1B0ESY5_LUTLO|nr:high affinity cationic amino acid transporter 1-like isoform X1 [Lutzomyia longipalpis]